MDTTRGTAMQVHDMTKAASTIVGLPAIGRDARCSECGYGTVRAPGSVASILVHSARCPLVVERQSEGLPLPPFLACRWTECKRVLDPARVAHGATACDEKHKTAAWKIEARYGRHDAVAVSARANGSQHRKKPSGLQVSHGKAREELLARLWHFPDGERLVDEALRAALSDRQRAQLDAKEQETAND